MKQAPTPNGEINMSQPGQGDHKSWPRRHPILTVILAALAVVIVASSLGNTTKPPPTALTVVDATAMADEFEANQVAAEHKWGGRYIQFTGVVSNINSSGIAFQNVTSKFSFTQVSCDVKDENVLATLAKGYPVTVRGVVGDDQILGVIYLKQCQVVQPAQ